MTRKTRTAAAAAAAAEVVAEAAAAVASAASRSQSSPRNASTTDTGKTRRETRKATLLGSASSRVKTRAQCRQAKRMSVTPVQGLHSPPDSNEAFTKTDDSDSELSDIPSSPRVAELIISSTPNIKSKTAATMKGEKKGAESAENLVVDGEECVERKKEGGVSDKVDSDAVQADAPVVNEQSPVPSEPEIGVSMQEPPAEVSEVSKPVENTQNHQVDENESDDIGEILPAEWSGTVPVFRPTMKQFKDFKLFMEKVDKYGMVHGIIKIVAPEEWKASLPPINDLVKQVRVRDPIKQDIMGSNGTYRQVNIVHGRSYNLPQWRALCDQSDHQPPARRGERRAEKPRITRTRKKTFVDAEDNSACAMQPVKTVKDAEHVPAHSRSTGSGRGRGRARGASRRGGRGGRRVQIQHAKDTHDSDNDLPRTPVSPNNVADIPLPSLESDDEDEQSHVGRVGGRKQRGGNQQSVSARRKFGKREGSAAIDERAFENFDYNMDISDYTPERCEELERVYWKTLTYAQPLYGADLMGTLFHEETELWNLNKLPSLLDVLGTKVPGVNTAYLYLGMWKATFAWHLEDVDLYSINYLHFGAPKQWYSISQADVGRFEAAMKSIWPTEAKACDQFLRHKGFLISPAYLQQHFNIRVNKCLSYPGEFVVTYPYGYHAGFNLGYNCAEAVNFALDSWLPMGKVARKCECAQAQDSVWVDVYEIERRLRGDPSEDGETEEEEEEEEEDDDEDEDEEADETSDEEEAEDNMEVGQENQIQESAAGKKVILQNKKPAKPRRGRPAKDVKLKEPKEKKIRKVKKVRRIRIGSKSGVESPCCLCPNVMPNECNGADLLPTIDNRQAHRLCARWKAEIDIETVNGRETATNIDKVLADGSGFKCLLCRSKKGVGIPCSASKCSRAYHATCAAASGGFVEEGEVPVIGADGTEYKEVAVRFTCRFHRTKRAKRLDAMALESCTRTRDAARKVKVGDVIQLQYYRSEIFAGVVLENSHSEEILVVAVLPHAEQVEVEWRWLLCPSPSDFHLPKASANALPLPTCRSARDKIKATERQQEDSPQSGSSFVAGDFTWAEFKTVSPSQLRPNPDQVKVDLSKPDQLWHYIYQGSTDNRAKFTEDPSRPIHNLRSVFLNTLPKPVSAVRRSSAFCQSPSTSSCEPSPLAPRPPARPLVQTPVSCTPAASASSTKSIGTPVVAGSAPVVSPPASSRPINSTISPSGISGKGSRLEKPYVYKPRIPVTPIAAEVMIKAVRRRSSVSTPTHSPLAPREQLTQRELGWARAVSTASKGHPARPAGPGFDGSVSMEDLKARYPFFAQHHNRPVSTYRSPYAPGFGFNPNYPGFQDHQTPYFSQTAPQTASHTAPNITAVQPQGNDQAVQHSFMASALPEAPNSMCAAVPKISQNGQQLSHLLQAHPSFPLPQEQLQFAHPALSAMPPSVPLYKNGVMGPSVTSPLNQVLMLPGGNESAQENGHISLASLHPAIRSEFRNPTSLSQNVAVPTSLHGEPRLMPVVAPGVPSAKVPLTSRQVNSCDAPVATSEGRPTAMPTSLTQGASGKHAPDISSVTSSALQFNALMNSVNRQTLEAPRALMSPSRSSSIPSTLSLAPQPVDSKPGRQVSTSSPTMCASGTEPDTYHATVDQSAPHFNVDAVLPQKRTVDDAGLEDSQRNEQEITRAHPSIRVAADATLSSNLQDNVHVVEMPTATLPTSNSAPTSGRATGPPAVAVCTNPADPADSAVVSPSTPLVQATAEHCPAPPSATHSAAPSDALNISDAPCDDPVSTQASAALMERLMMNLRRVSGVTPSYSNS